MFNCYVFVFFVEIIKSVWWLIWWKSYVFLCVIIFKINIMFVYDLYLLKYLLFLMFSVIEFEIGLGWLILILLLVLIWNWYVVFGVRLLISVFFFVINGIVVCYIFILVFLYFIVYVVIFLFLFNLGGF